MKRDEVIYTADRHAELIERALERIRPLLPLDEEKVQSFGIETIMPLDLLMLRFIKLQDLVGNQLFDVILEVAAEQHRNLSVRDKLNKLEKLGVIDSGKTWLELRNVRNYITHEYPENPLVQAEQINLTATHCRLLISYYKQMRSWLLDHK